MIPFLSKISNGVVSFKHGDMGNDQSLFAPFQIIVGLAQRGFGEPDAKHGLHARDQCAVLNRPGDVAIRAGFQPGDLTVRRRLDG